MWIGEGTCVFCDELEAHRVHVRGGDCGAVSDALRIECKGYCVWNVRDICKYVCVVLQPEERPRMVKRLSGSRRPGLLRSLQRPQWAI